MFKKMTTILTSVINNKDILPTGLKFSDLSFNRGFNIIVEGNIGCGKSTLINHLKNVYDKVNVFCEPIEKWRDVKGVNLFDLMYKDPKRFGFTFQSYVQLTMLQQHELLNKLSHEQNQINFCERSIISARYIFVENLYRKELLTRLEYGILDDYFKYFVTKDKIDIDLIVYMKSTPELCHRRVLERSRPEEKCLSLNDFAFFHQLHEELFGSKERLISQLWEIPMLTLDADLSKEKLFETIDEYLHSNYNRDKFRNYS